MILFNIDSGCACRQMQHREWAEVSPRLPQISHEMHLCHGDTESFGSNMEEMMMVSLRIAH